MAMYIPLQLRLTLFYTLVLGVALWFFGQTVFMQAEQRAYSDLDTNLSSRAASVRLGKDLFVSNPNTLPLILPSVDSLGTGGVSIEVLDEKLALLATTSGALNGGTQTFDAGLRAGGRMVYYVGSAVGSTTHDQDSAEYQYLR